MFTFQEMLDLVNKNSVIFYKPGCPYCASSEKLIKALNDAGKIGNFKIYYQGKDFNNQSLKELVLKYGWKERFEGDVPTKPQIFINNGQITDYIGGNSELYRSDYNKVDGPNLENPMGS